MRAAASDAVPDPAAGVDSNPPVIGLSTYGIAHADGFNIPAEYVQAVLRAGGLPLAGKACAHDLQFLSGEARCMDSWAGF